LTQLGFPSIGKPLFFGLFFSKHWNFSACFFHPPSIGELWRDKRVGKKEKNPAKPLFLGDFFLFLR